MQLTNTGTMGGTLRIGLQNGLEREKIRYVSYDGLERKKAIDVGCNSLKM